MPVKTQAAPGFGPPEDVKGFGPPELTTEESEHARQLVSSQPLSSVVPQGGFVQRFASGVGIPTSKEEWKSAKDAVDPGAWGILGPAAIAGKLALGYGKDILERGKEALQDDPAAMPGPFGPGPGKFAKFMLRGPLGPLGGEAAYQGVQDVKDENYTGAAGDLGAVVTNLLTLKGAENPSRGTMVDKLTRAAGEKSHLPIAQTIDTLIKEAAGKKVQTLGDLQGITKTAKSKINMQFDDAIGPYGHLPYMPMDANGKSIIASRIRELKNRFTDITADGREAKDLIEQAAVDYDKPHTLSDLNKERTQLNAELSNHSALNPNVRYTKEHGNVQLLIDSTIKDALRDTVYPYADKLAGKPDGYFETLKQQQANLIRLETLLHDRIETLTGKASAARGKSVFERSRFGVAAGTGGNVHGWASGLKDVAIPDEELKPANRSVKKAFTPGSPVARAAILSLPLRNLIFDPSNRIPTPPALKGSPLDEQQ